MKNSILCFLLFLIITSCATRPLKDYANSWIGANLNEIKETERLDNVNDYVNNWRDKGTNKDYYLSNGNLVYVYPERKGCIVHWEIDKNSNKIIRYKFEGDNCY